MVTINDILENHIIPFEHTDESIKKLFSFFLHLAPTIESKSAGQLPSDGLDVAWKSFLNDTSISHKDYQIYAPGYIKDKQLLYYKLDKGGSVNRKTKRFICNRKQLGKKEEHDLEVLLRHIRNSIAHSNVYVLDQGRKYIIFDDYNKKENMTARILLSQTDLKKLRHVLNQKKH